MHDTWQKAVQKASTLYTMLLTNAQNYNSVFIFDSVKDYSII